MDVCCGPALIIVTGVEFRMVVEFNELPFTLTVDGWLSMLLPTLVIEWLNKKEKGGKEH